MVGAALFYRLAHGAELTEAANMAPLITRLREETLDAAFLRRGAAGAGELQVRRLSEEPMVVALPKRHHAAAFEQVDLVLLKDDPFLLFPREIAPTLYDTVVDACRKAGFEPIIGQLVPHMASIVNQSSVYRSFRRR